MKSRIFLPSLTGGVSRQPQTQRLLNQVQQADNCTMAMARGLQKRPGTQHSATLNLTQADPQDQAIIWCQDYSGTKFFVVLNKTLTDPIKAYKIDGTALTIAYAGGQQADIRAYLKSGSTNSQNSFCSAYFANQLMIGNVDVVTALTGSAGNYQYSGTAVRLPANTHNKTSADAFDLPPAADGQYWYAQSSTVGFPRGFYISQNSAGVGPWYVRVKTEEASSDINDTTMPVVCSLSGSTLTFSKVVWDSRLSGSSLTNPGPTFIGKKITSILYHRSRLFFGADDRLVASSTNRPYNFWVDDFANLSDDDPVDIGITADSGKINHLVSFAKAMVITTTRARQFQLRSDGPLTPTGVSLIATTGIQCSDICNPSIIGNHLYWCTDRGNGGQVYDYFYSFDAASNIAPDVSAHVQGYLPTGLSKMSVSPSNDILVISSRDQVDALYAYQSYFTNTQRIQASWFRWTFADAQVRSHQCFQGILYVLMFRVDTYYVQTIQMYKAIPQDTQIGYPVLYDRCTVVNGTYNSTTNTTTWTIPYPDIRVTQLVLGTSFGGNVGRRLPVTGSIVGATTVVHALGRYDQGQAWAGIPYTMSVQLSQQFVRDDNQGVIMGSLQLLLMKIDHKDTSGYDVVVTPGGRDPKTWRFTPLILGQITLGQIAVQQYGTFYCKPYCSAHKSTIVISSTSPLPCNISNVEFTGRFVKGKASVV